MIDIKKEVEETESFDLVELVSCDNKVFRIKRELAIIIPEIRDKIKDKQRFVFNYIESRLMEKVIEYLGYRHKYSNINMPSPAFHIDESIVMDLLIVADKLGI
ncbi:Skp1 family protein [Cryptosporidium muris RN66]|uniref:Elongin-C n=1 Tax=Cryptosporidium muris (strain RN66) TaxID=441375 RepID=B6ADC4_CRYMR|nr:Skp1 family protein [Cryptosporidium muris RN66]EEA06215.1 Skp1 family protein [Cryptosporidium muris RN66]|eukprot:XP_002140564.1 Skp1 family protein [Cryptosporidium muris RN66]